MTVHGRWRRAIVALLLAGLFCVQCTRSEAFRQSDLVVAVSGKSFGANAPHVLRKVQDLARNDHVGLLEYCLENYQGRYSNYTCTFIKQERINGLSGGRQEISVKFMDHPYSVAMAWTPETAPVADRVIYVEGRHNNQMLVRPKGFLGALVGTVLRKPDGPDVMRNTLRPVNMFGFKRTLQRLLKVYRQAQRNGDLKEAFGGYAEVAGRKAIVLVRYLPAKNNYPAHKVITYIDLEYLLPIAVEAYDWDDQLCSRYIYKDVRFNIALEVDDFLPEANGMKPLR